MSIEATILARAIAHTGLNALIAGRCYNKRAARTLVYPYLVFRKISSVRNPTFAHRAQIVNSRMQITIHANSDTQLEAVRAQVEDAFDVPAGFGIVLRSDLEMDHGDADLEDTTAEERLLVQDYRMHYSNPSYA